jgi:hypothetical protein
MKPEKALELVQQYARLNFDIKAVSSNISSHLSRCKGISGKRQDPFYYPEFDNKNRELDLHLVQWYTPERGEYGSATWEEIGIHEHGEECCHCYEAHLLIQKRKGLRQELGQVKRVMSRSLS